METEFLRLKIQGGTMSEPIIVVPYDPKWKEDFVHIGELLRVTLGDIALRIDHIGSTSITGLDAKPIIDIQISVKFLETLEIYKPLLESIGYVHRVKNPDKTKSYFRESGGMK